MTRKLNVFVGGIHAGELSWDSNLDVFSFSYVADYLKREGAIPISKSMPLRDEAFDALVSRTFFENILPPEAVRRRLEKILHHDWRNTFAFLEELGGDCAGAVSLFPEGVEPSAADGRIRELSEEEADEILRALPERPLLQGLVDGYRISVAGAQDKLVARVRDGRLALPLYGAASTHIVKPEMSICRDSVANECFCQRLAGRLGLAAAKASILAVKSRPYYVSERYDREADGESVRRLLQEDFCQAMGVPAEEKYESDGGPSAVRCFRFLRDAGFGFANLSAFVDSLIFNFIVGNADAHAKNFSIVYRDGTAELSPLYDILSTAVYPNLTSRMAMSIGGAWEFEDVTAASFDAFAEKCDIKAKFVRDRIANLADGLSQAMEDVAGELSDAGHPSRIYGLISSQSQRRLAQLISRSA